MKIADLLVALGQLTEIDDGQYPGDEEDDDDVDKPCCPHRGSTWTTLLAEWPCLWPLDLRSLNGDYQESKPIPMSFRDALDAHPRNYRGVSDRSMRKLGGNYVGVRHRRALRRSAS